MDALSKHDRDAAIRAREAIAEIEGAYNRCKNSASDGDRAKSLSHLALAALNAKSTIIHVGKAISAAGLHVDLRGFPQFVALVAGLDHRECLLNPNGQFSKVEAAWPDAKAALDDARYSITQALSVAGPTPAGGNASIDDDPGPMAWKDRQNGKIYRFTGKGKVLYDLWMVLAEKERRFTRDQLRERVPQWGEDSITTDATIDKHVKNLRAFWKRKDRPDIAEKITWAGSAVGYNIPE